MVREYLVKRDVELSEFEAKDWTDEDRGKITQIIDIVLGNDISAASNSIKGGSNSSKSNKKTSFEESENDEDIDNFFEDADEDQ